ncbi:ribosomal protein L7/L12 [Myxococcota bacterium]
MSDENPCKLRSEVITKLISTPTTGIPRSSLGRLRYLSSTTFHGGKLMVGQALRKTSAADELDLDELIAMVSSIGELKGVAMKLGQILSYIGTSVPVTARTTLSALQTHSQPLPFRRVRKILSRELGAKAQPLLDNMDSQPIAAASIGQVHRAALPDGTQVAVKIRYPDIDKAVARDFGPAAVGGAVATFFLPTTKLKSFVREARARFLEECDYRHEAHCQRRFSDLFAYHPLIAVPQVHARYCSHRVLTTTFFEGAYLEEYLASNPTEEDRDRLAQALFEFYIGSLFKYGIYNCDPHPGNYLFLPDGRIAVLDFGCAREFDPAFVSKMAALTRAVHADAPDLLHSAFVDLGIVDDGQQYDRETARRLMRAFYGPMLHDAPTTFERNPGAKIRELDKKSLLQLALPGELLFLMRVRFGLGSVLARIGTRANWYRLICNDLEERVAHGAATWQTPRFDVILVDAGQSTIQVIREIRAATGVPIKKAKGLIEGTPQPIQQAVEKEEAEALLEKLESAGGRVEIRPAS